MTDVLVVGAGPTGLMLAAELLRHGLRPLVIDQEARPSGLSRAIVVHARTLEVLETHGLAGALVDRGQRLHRVQMWAGGGVAVDVSFGGLPTRYPFLLGVPQCDTEAVLASRVEALGGQIVRGVALRGFRQDEDGVTAELSDRAIRVGWLVGCDGAHSAVRHGLGLDFPGHAIEEKLVLGDVDWDVDLPRDALTTFFDDGLVACFPLPGSRRWRLIATVDEGDGDVTMADLAAIVSKRTPFAPRLTEARWLARFRIHSRQVDRYRGGRVLLAGDAAHIHSPAGGQGMNTGIQDAHNLGWKLALVARGAPDALLDTYEAERRPIAAQILRTTEAATRVGTLRNAAVRKARDLLAGALSRWSLVTDRIVRAVSELDVAYPDSPIVLHDAPALEIRAGDRPAGLPVDIRPMLLSLAGPQLDDDGRRRLRICRAVAKDRGLGIADAPSAFGVAGDGIAVVRPDGYLGLVQAPARPEAFAAWLDRTLGA